MVTVDSNLDDKVIGDEHSANMAHGTLGGWKSIGKLRVDTVVFQSQPIRTATVVSLSTRVTAEVHRDEVVFMTTFFQSGYFILQHKHKTYSIHTT